LDWLLRASALENVAVEFVPTTEPLAVCYMEQSRDRMSNRRDWRYTLSWIQASRHLLSQRAYAGFILTWMASPTVQQGDREAFWPLLREACRHGQPAVVDILTYLGYWLIPDNAQARLASFFDRFGSKAAPGRK
jgi:hypothetical protein